MRNVLLNEKNIKILNIIWVIFFSILAILCFVSFQYSYDLSHTIACTYALLNGHIKDFYDFCMEQYQEINYMPTTYLVFAIWNLPLKILGVNI